MTNVTRLKPTPTEVIEAPPRFPKRPYKRPLMVEPDEVILARWLERGRARATCGCWTYIDGACQKHGHVSWLVFLKMI